MDLRRNPQLAERLAAAYALGTLRGGARRRFEKMAWRNPALRAQALVWQERFAAMTELQPQTPSPNVWKRIELALDDERASARRASEASTPRASGSHRLWGWRAGALAGGIASVAAIAVSAWLASQLDVRDVTLAQLRTERETVTQRNAQLVSQLGAMPQIQYVAVLSDDRSAPAVLVTFDPRNSMLTLKRVGGFQEGAEKSLQLWALPPAGGPRSLGVLGEGGVVKLTAAESQVREVPALAISLEPKGGVPSERGPTGPVLFKGALLPTS
ncbi:MAG TPA: anti-sigma factor [Ramlibacter sp.]|nr:anti-sigma factor [Ramlibacter sp.]